jgi:hypothetical protein
MNVTLIWHAFSALRPKLDAWGWLSTLCCRGQGRERAGHCQAMDCKCFPQAGPRPDVTEMRHENRDRTEASMASRMLEESYKLGDKEKVALEAASNSYMAGVG